MAAENMNLVSGVFQSLTSFSPIELILRLDSEISQTLSLSSIVELE